ncbi:MAG: YicC family protein [Spirochaetaceae bacterium]|jgi:uncharacterized protein (TIGR00255 family)|nr:YicC family protein [Spirochaetaceae bacterium]
MKSMTGYAWATRKDEQYFLSVEIKGYNSRFLEMSVYLPPFLSGLESRIRERISNRYRRGKIEAAIKLREYNAQVSVSVNREAVRAYAGALALLAEEFGLEGRPSLEMLINLEGVLETERPRDDERCWTLIEPALDDALERFEAERSREGRHTEENILSHVERIESLLEAVNSQAPLIEAAFRDNLRNRFREVLGEADEGRIITETAVLLVKASIAEELSRLSAHLAEFRAEAAQNPAPGKKLDFLSQEINREVNTIGSKSPDLTVSRAVVDMKDAIENIREQLRNVE